MQVWTLASFNEARIFTSDGSVNDSDKPVSPYRFKLSKLFLYVLAEVPRNLRETMLSANIF